MISFLKENVLRIVLICGFIIGIQIPNFIIQYTQRIDAHLKEAEINFMGFQKTADQFFKGDVFQLIQKHLNSGDSVFVEEAKIIQTIQNRITNFHTELEELDTNLLNQIIHMIFKSDYEIIWETYSSYIPTVPLTFESILCGIIISYTFIYFLQFIFYRIKIIVRNRRKKFLTK